VSAPTLSLVVVTHDSADDLARLLGSVEQHLVPAPELVVVDSGSSSPAGANLARDAGAIVIDLPGNPGFGAANNAGVARASGEVCALLNPDVELLDDGLAVLAGRAAGRRQLLVPRLLNADGSEPSRGAEPAPSRSAGRSRRAWSRPRSFYGAWVRSTPRPSCSMRISTCACGHGPEASPRWCNPTSR
jgi:GT2 family glycosyltransferase